MQSTGYYPPPSQQQAYNMLQQQQPLPPQQTSPLPTRQLARPIPQQQLPHHHQQQQQQQQQHNLSQVMEDGQDPLDDDEDADEEKKPMRRSGRRKIKIEYIEDKTRRHITFSKRKAGIMKKAYELSTLTGTQVLLLVVSETGLVYTFTTPKLQPLVTKPEGKNLIQSCLNAPDNTLTENGNQSSSMMPSPSMVRMK